MKKLLIALVLATFVCSGEIAAEEMAVMSSTTGSTPEGSATAPAPAKEKKGKKHGKKAKKAKKKNR